MLISNARPYNQVNTNLYISIRIWSLVLVLLFFYFGKICLNISFFFWCLVLFCISFLFCYNIMGVRDLLYRRIWRVWEICKTVSLFFWCPVLFCFSFLFCFNMMSVRDLLYCWAWWVRETCHTISFFFTISGPLYFSSFSVLASLLLFRL